MVPQSRARFVWLFLSLAMVCLFAPAMTGCQPAEAPFQGAMVSEEELPRRVEAAVRAQQEADRLEAEQIAREQAKRQAAFELAVSRMDATHALDLASLRAEYEASAASTRDALAAITRRSEAAIAAIRDEATGAAADIQRQNEQRLGAFSFVEKVLPMTPAAPWGEIILGVAASALGLERIRKGASAAKAEKQAAVDKDANWEDGYKRGLEAARAEREAADKAWDEAMLTVAAGRIAPAGAPASRVGPA